MNKFSFVQFRRATCADPDLPQFKMLLGSRPVRHVAKENWTDYAVICVIYDNLERQLTKRGDLTEPAGSGGASRQKPQRDAAAAAQPAWAKGLQRLYNEVVEEALPDDLAQLLDKLDRAADAK